MNWNILQLLLTPVAVCLSVTTPSLAQETQVPTVEVTGTAPGFFARTPLWCVRLAGWTTQRAFGASRVYVRPPGTLLFKSLDAGMEGWGGRAQFREEVEIGLPTAFSSIFIKLGHRGRRHSLQRIESGAALRTGELGQNSTESYLLRRIEFNDALPASGS